MRPTEKIADPEWKDIHDRDKRIAELEAFVRDECAWLDGHACVTGDCPHDTRWQCLDELNALVRGIAERAQTAMESEKMMMTSVADAFAAALERVPERRRRVFRRLVMARMMALLNMSARPLAIGLINEVLDEVLGDDTPLAVDDSELHPFGRCTCGGEGDCDWCNKTEAAL